MRDEGGGRRRAANCPQCDKAMTTPKSLKMGLCSRCRKLAKPLAKKASKIAQTPVTADSAAVMGVVADHVTRLSGIEGDAEMLLHEYLKDKRPQTEAFMQLLATHQAGRLQRLTALIHVLESELFRPERLMLMPSETVLRALEYISRSMTAAIEFVRETNDRADTSWAQAVEEKLRKERTEGARSMSVERRERIVGLTQSLASRLRGLDVEPTEPVQ